MELCFFRSSKIDWCEKLESGLAPCNIDAGDGRKGPVFLVPFLGPIAGGNGKEIGIVMGIGYEQHAGCTATRACVLRGFLGALSGEFDFSLPPEHVLFGA